LLIVLLALAGCGSSASTQTITGDGYTFTAPGGWAVVPTPRGMAASSGAVDRVEVVRFRLVRSYRPALFRSVSRELDGVAHRLAAQLGGRVRAAATVDVAGRRARSYRIAYGDKVQQITFVLDGSREYQLLCRREAGKTDSACRGLTAGFSIG